MKFRILLVVMITVGLGTAAYVLLSPGHGRLPGSSNSADLLESAGSDDLGDDSHGSGTGNIPEASLAGDEKRQNQTGDPNDGSAQQTGSGSRTDTKPVPPVTSEVPRWYKKVDEGSYSPVSLPDPGYERPCASYVPTLSDSSLQSMVANAESIYSPAGAALFIIRLVPVGYDAQDATPAIEIVDIETGETWTASGLPTIEGSTYSSRRRATYILVPHRPAAILLVRARLGSGRGTLLFRPDFFQARGGGVSPSGFVERTGIASEKGSSKALLKVLCFDPERSDFQGSVIVRDPDGEPVSDALVVKDGQIVGRTDKTGNSQVYGLPEGWDAAQNSVGVDNVVSRYAVWRRGYTPRFVATDAFMNQSLVEVTFSRREVFVGGGVLKGRLPDERQLALEFNAPVVYRQSGPGSKSLSLAMSEWRYKNFPEMFFTGPLDDLYFGPLHKIRDTTPDEVRHRQEEWNRTILETRLRPLAEACGQEDPDWQEFQEWYGHMWRLEGSNFSAVLPFSGRFLVVIGRDSTGDPGVSPEPVQTHVVEVDVRNGMKPIFTLRARD
ncbi:MAG: hypothetical protein K8I27_14195 [Planctomycetes bacterium]|nr:hypothetical protein [Planctomycetota bacterium]